jgi:hypothetical protein
VHRNLSARPWCLSPPCPRIPSPFSPTANPLSNSLIFQPCSNNGIWAQKRRPQPRVGGLSTSARITRPVRRRRSPTMTLTPRWGHRIRVKGRPRRVISAGIEKPRYARLLPSNFTDKTLFQCSGDHPVCKRCTARGLICHYAGRERVRGPARARLRNAMSSSSLDLHFSGDSDGDAQMIKQEDPAQSLMYSLEYLSHQQSQYQHLAFPTQHPFPYSQPCSQGGSPARDFQLPRMSLPQVSHRRVQSHSALGAGEPYGHPRYHPSGSTVSRLGPASVVEFDMRIPNGGQIQDYREDGGSSRFVLILRLSFPFSTDV